MQRLSAILAMRQHEAAPALIDEAEVLSYSALWERVSSAAEKLRGYGVKPEHRVVVTLPNTAALPIALMALSEAGAISIPLAPSLSGYERGRILNTAQPHFELSSNGESLVTAGALLTRLGDNPSTSEPDLDHVAAIIFTSGTTGAPKGVMLSAAALLTNAQSVVDYLRLSTDDRTLIFLPLYYSYPLSQLLSTWLAGGSVVLVKNLMFPAEVLKSIDRYQVTGFGGVPTSLNLLARQATRPLDSLRYVMSAGGPLSRQLASMVNAAFPGARVFNNYGCTEVGPRATTVDYSTHPDKVGSIGRAIGNVDVRLVRADLTEAELGETAEIVLNGPTLMTGYFRDPDATAARMSRWGFHTGDYAYADDDGFLFFQGRGDDIFKCGGEKVSAREIEEVLLEHPSVREVAIVSETDAILGSVATAYVVRREGDAATQADLQLFCRGKLSIHKVPRTIHFVPQLDHTATGKVQKFRLRELSIPKGAAS